MTVKEVIIQTLRLVGREDVADAVASGEQLDEEMTRLKRAFITYLNAVLDELARGYFPLDYVEDMSAEDGRYAFSAFSKPPLKIRRVTCGQRRIEWRLCPDCLVADSPNITVTYEYAPSALGEDDEFFYPVFAVGERLVSCGMAAEYYLVMGDASASQAWEDKYRSEIELLLSHSTVRGRIPPRRWI